MTDTSKFWQVPSGMPFGKVPSGKTKCEVFSAVPLFQFQFQTPRQFIYSSFYSSYLDSSPSHHLCFFSSVHLFNAPLQCAYSARLPKMASLHHLRLPKLASLDFSSVSLATFGAVGSLTPTGVPCEHFDRGGGEVLVSNLRSSSSLVLFAGVGVQSSR
jgi:hypothetical protein